jgi:iron-sulfur cluster repair protein YtfE (RIC family)
VTVTQPLRQEHAELLPYIQALAEAGDSVGRVSIARLESSLDELLDFLNGELIPHARAEEAVLYPVVQHAVDAPEMTATMERDHVEVGRLTKELTDIRHRLEIAASMDDDLADALRRVLYGLHHIVKLHFAKEEEIYLPILDAHISQAEADAMFSDMQAASRHGHE